MTAEPDTVLDGITYLQLDAEDQAVFPIKDAFDRSHAFIGIIFFRTFIALRLPKRKL